MNTREGERILSRRKRGLREKKTKIHSEDLINIKKYKNWVWIFELSARSSSTSHILIQLLLVIFVRPLSKRTLTFNALRSDSRLCPIRISFA